MSPLRRIVLALVMPLVIEGTPPTPETFESLNPGPPAMPYTYKYPRPAVTVDCVVFGLNSDDLKVLLIQRGQEPFAGRWALPGGFVGMDESLEQAARRELQEETGLARVYLEQLYTFGDPRRTRHGTRNGQEPPPCRRSQ